MKKSKPRKPFDSKGIDILAIGTFVQTKQGQRGIITDSPDQYGQYEVYYRYGRGSHTLRIREDMRPITREEFFTYHKNTVILDY